MKIVILAAGIGSRLGDHDLPKPLTPLFDNKSILQRQLEQIEKFASLEEVRVVVGYHKEMFEKFYPSLHYIENSRYASTNTAKSLLCAIENIDDDVVWLNGDVVFHESVIESILKDVRSLMVVNCARVAEEEVKYVTDGRGRLLQVSKQIANAEGEALGINRFQANDLPYLKQYLRECTDKDYFERAIEKCIDSGVHVFTQVVDVNDCAEIDFPDDLKRANVLVQMWTETGTA